MREVVGREWGGKIAQVFSQGHYHGWGQKIAKKTFSRWSENASKYLQHRSRPTEDPGQYQ